jgi:hypothetical protein
MHRISLLLFFVVASPLFAQTTASDFDLLKKPAAPFDVSQFRLGTRHHSTYRKPQNISTEPDEVCFKLRTYVVLRENPQSDVTRVVGSSSCQWSSQFTVKSAVEVVKYK